MKSKKYDREFKLNEVKHYKKAEIHDGDIP